MFSSWKTIWTMSISKQLEHKTDIQKGMISRYMFSLPGCHHCFIKAVWILFSKRILFTGEQRVTFRVAWLRAHKALTPFSHLTCAPFVSSSHFNLFYTRWLMSWIRHNWLLAGHFIFIHCNQLYLVTYQHNQMSSPQHLLHCLVECMGMVTAIPPSSHPSL